MTTRVIGMKEFRQNMSKLSKEAKRKKIRFVVMNHSTPIFEVSPVLDREELEDRLIVEKYGQEILESLEQARRGEVYSAEEVREYLGLKRSKT